MSADTRSLPCDVQVGLARASFPMGRLEFGPAHLVVHGAGSPCVLDAKDVVRLERVAHGVRVRHASRACPAFICFGSAGDAAHLVERIRRAGFVPMASPDREHVPKVPAPLLRIPLETTIAILAAALAGLAIALPLWV